MGLWFWTRSTGGRFLRSLNWVEIEILLSKSMYWISKIASKLESIVKKKVVHIMYLQTYEKSLWKYIISFVWFHFWCYFWTPRSFIWTIEFQCKLRLTTSKIGLQFCPGWVNRLIPPTIWFLAQPCFFIFLLLCFSFNFSEVFPNSHPRLTHRLK